MAGSTFDYSQKGDRWYPTVDIELKGPRRTRTFRALVDSGASVSIFRSEIAEFLGVELEKGEPMYFQGVGGKILAYVHQLPVSVAGHKFQCKIAFSREFTVSLNILGRDNFFKEFIVCLNESEQQVRLNWKASAINKSINQLNSNQETVNWLISEQ